MAGRRATYPAIQLPAGALVQVDAGGHYQVRIDASDTGNGVWTVLTQIAADALEVPIELVRLEIGDSSLPQALVMGDDVLMGVSSGW